MDSPRSVRDAASPATSHGELVEERPESPRGICLELLRIDPNAVRDWLERPAIPGEVGQIGGMGPGVGLSPEPGMAREGAGRPGTPESLQGLPVVSG